MSLKEALERERMQLDAFAKTEDFCRKLFEEVGMCDGAEHDHAFYQRSYEQTLPEKLPPEYQALVDEFVELCPPKAWKKCPERADRALTFCDWAWDDEGNLTAEYRGETLFGQVKLSDGSLHIKRCEMYSRRNLGKYSDLVKHRHRFFSKAQNAEAERVRFSARESILQEAQRKMDGFHRFLYGSGEYVCLPYSIPHGDYDDRCHVCIFREKVLYDLGKDANPGYKGGGDAPFRKGIDAFENWLLIRLKGLSN